MKTRTLVVALAGVVLFAATAMAQVPLPVNKGTVFKGYYSYTASSTASYTFSGATTASSVFAGNSTSTYGSYRYRFVSQAVVAVSLSPRGSRLPSVANATLNFYGVSSLSGTWQLWVQTASPNGTIGTSDWVNATGAGFALVGSRSFSTTGSGSISFGITSQLNNDLGTPGRAWSSYTLTKAGPLTGMGLTGSYTPQGPPIPVPEPGTFALFGLGLLTLCAGHRIRSRRRGVKPEE